MPPRLIVGALAATLLSGCLFNSLSPTEGLSDQVYGLNEESRWDRLDLAVQRVVPLYRPRFVQSRRAWGRDISIADTEVSALVVAEDLASATSRVEISWYSERTMVLRSTVIRQTWKRTDDGYLLEDETVISGDESLLTTDDDEEEETLSAAG